MLGYTDLLVCRSRPDQVDDIEREFGARSFFDLNVALAQQPDVVLITNPTVLHIPVALAAAQAGCHLFIEKPVSHAMAQIQDLRRLVAQKQLVAMVAYNLRFQPGLRLMSSLLQAGEIGRVLSVRAEVGSYLPDWRPNTDYRQTYSAKAELGGGVVLDLSHELDYLVWLFGPVRYVSSMMGTLGNLEIESEDTAEILLEHTNGVLSSLHLDYVQRDPVRYCKVIGTDGVLVWDYYADQVKSFRAATKSWQSHKFTPEERNEMYIAELRHFISCIKEQKTPLISLDEGIRILQVALTAKEAASVGCRQKVDDEF
jgi:predicted dehydrogenase